MYSWREKNLTHLGAAILKTAYFTALTLHTVCSVVTKDDPSIGLFASIGIGNAIGVACMVWLVEHEHATLNHDSHARLVLQSMLPHRTWRWKSLETEQISRTQMLQSDLWKIDTQVDVWGGIPDLVSSIGTIFLLPFEGPSQSHFLLLPKCFQIDDLKEEEKKEGQEINKITTNSPFCFDEKLLATLCMWKVDRCNADLQVVVHTSKYRLPILYSTRKVQMLTTYCTRLARNILCIANPAETAFPGWRYIFFRET
jgi:hypothetical protein